MPSSDKARGGAIGREKRKISAAPRMHLYQVSHVSSTAIVCRDSGVHMLKITMLETSVNRSLCLGLRVLQNRSVLDAIDRTHALSTKVGVEVWPGIGKTSRS
jgi:hypothetical protein